MDTENNSRLQLRIAIGMAFVIIGLALLGVAMTSILQAEATPWWVIPLMVMGVTAIIGGLLILIVTPKHWKRIWQSVVGFPTWLQETCIWKRYGPACTLGEPEVTFELSQDGQTRIYTARISLSLCLLEKNRNYYPVRIIIDKGTTMFYLEQKRGLVKLARVHLDVVTGTIKEILLNTPGKTVHEIAFSQSLYNNHSIAFIDIQKAPYEWIIEGIEVHLAQIHKFRKLSKRGNVSNVEKA